MEDDLQVTCKIPWKKSSKSNGFTVKLKGLPMSYPARVMRSPKVGGLL